MSCMMPMAALRDATRTRTRPASTLTSLTPRLKEENKVLNFVAKVAVFDVVSMRLILGPSQFDVKQKFTIRHKQNRSLTFAHKSITNIRMPRDNGIQIVYRVTQEQAALLDVLAAAVASEIKLPITRNNYAQMATLKEAERAAGERGIGAKPTKARKGT